jgi:tRNA-splicing ligase RtcB (3'-phosphate/5'-hydroxy nucleic acid ligase)
MQISDLTQLGKHEWEIPRAYRTDMRVPVRLFAAAENLQQIIADKSLEQAVNATTLPGVVGAVMVMPDVHQGYGFPIGGVAATQYPHGVISPGAIGYDINCGVRLLASTVTLDDAGSMLRSLANRLYAYCPTGVGGAGAIQVSGHELNQVLTEGSAWAREAGYATESDIERTEDEGQLEGADPNCVSARAKDRGRHQLGSLGAGNHFLEVDVIDEVFDEQLATTFGLHAGCLAIQIHCGSRGLGHQVCTDYVQQFQSVARAFGIQLPDRELVCAPLDSEEGRAYLAAMRAAANFAFVNRQILAHFVRRAFGEALGSATAGRGLYQVYDVAHNMGKLENHDIAGRSMRVCVHRKGATRAFGPGAADLPAQFARSGQPVLVPGSMGTGSWILAGAPGSSGRSLGSCCHGAGRLWSRTRARKEVRGDELRSTLERQGIIIRAGSLAGLAEEAPNAYKDVDAVVETVAAVGIALKVARLRPLVVIKG